MSLERGRKFECVLWAHPFSMFAVLGNMMKDVLSVKVGVSRYRDVWWLHLPTHYGCFNKKISEEVVEQLYFCPPPPLYWFIHHQWKDNLAPKQNMLGGWGAWGGNSNLPDPNHWLFLFPRRLSVQLVYSSIDCFCSVFQHSAYVFIFSLTAKSFWVGAGEC